MKWTSHADHRDEGAGAAPEVLPCAPSSEPTSALPPALDSEILEELARLELPGEPSLLAEMTAIFVETVPDHIARIAAALNAGDAVSLISPAHMLKGGAAALGATNVRRLSGELEMSGRTQQLDGAVDLLTALRSAVDEALQALAAIQPLPHDKQAA